MNAAQLLWGLLAIAAGGFFAVYGFTLFRIALLCLGFLIGFTIGITLMRDQPDFIRVVVSLVTGGIGGALLFFLFSMSIYIAGGLLGVTIALLVMSLFSIGNQGLLPLALILAGGGTGGYFGRLLGRLIIIFATAVVGSYVIVYGISILFPAEFGTDLELVGRIPISALSLTLLITFGLISGLAQYQILALQQRLRR